MKKNTRLPIGPFPVIPMRNMVLYPGQTMPVVVGRPRSRLALEAALQSDNEWVVLVAQKHDIGDQEPAATDLYQIGVVARIDRTENASGSYQLLLTGLNRFSISRFEEQEGFLRAHGENLDDVRDVEGDTLSSLTQNLKTLAGEIFDLLPGNTDRYSSVLHAIEDPVLMTHLVSQHLDVKITRKQELLEMTSLKNRLLSLLEQMVHLREELRLQKEVNQKLSSRLGKQHRDAILREQIRTLQEELGDKSSGGQGDDLRSKITAAQMPEDVEKIALEQLQRLETIGQQSPESHVIRNYLDLLVALPWNVHADSKIDLDQARKILEEDHYGLERIKKRILQHLAVLKLREKKGSILLFVGPPGVGKTSLGKSIARAMGRKFVRVSLGGVRDDAEIRGHRRTYVGALPGRIIDGIKRAGENNPVFMLDEIDKMTRGWGGDPAASMLEVLDPEQNAKFLDHYLDVSFDLSNVFFIATANTTETIPAPLLDRMEVIQLNGYTIAEKLHISRNHLVPKQLEDHGVKAEQLEIGEAAQLRMIHSYTREAGVRELQRIVGSVVRASTEKVLANTTGQPVKVDIQDLEEILGPERFVHELVGAHNPPGVVTGLAWTPMGGDILFIESSHMPGRGKLILTGQLGDVMRESAQIALTLVRSRLAASSTALAYDREDLHVHVPAGAIPKDGPSAGVAMLSAIASLVLNKPVSSKMAMTGEITLRGAVTPVGGIKEKVIAAHRAGIEKVLLPKRNERDLKEVPDEVKKGLQFVFAETVEEALHHVLGIEPEQWSTPRPPVGAETTTTKLSSDCH
ncbi:MAG: endopeptidase La [Bdellovibrionales bacterium]|nr:endopeptidase La [Bdellovibrionales bacterium]